MVAQDDGGRVIAASGELPGKDEVAEGESHGGLVNLQRSRPVALNPRIDLLNHRLVRSSSRGIPNAVDVVIGLNAAELSANEVFQAVGNAVSIQLGAAGPVVAGFSADVHGVFAVGVHGVGGFVGFVDQSDGKFNAQKDSGDGVARAGKRLGAAVLVEPRNGLLDIGNGDHSGTMRNRGGQRVNQVHVLHAHNIPKRLGYASAKVSFFRFVCNPLWIRCYRLRTLLRNCNGKCRSSHDWRLAQPQPGFLRIPRRLRKRARRVPRPGGCAMQKTCCPTIGSMLRMVEMGAARRFQDI